MRHTLLLGLAALFAAVALSPTASGTPSGGCPNGYDAVAVPTDASQITQPRLLAGIQAGVYTAEELIASAHGIDANGDGVFCIKPVSNLGGESVKHWAYFYAARDDDSSAVAK